MSPGSRRIYRIALTTWAWALVDRAVPVGGERRNAAPPAVPLTLLDTPYAAGRIREAFTARAATVGVRTANRELSILGSAVGWWRAQGWLSGDPTAGLRPLPVKKTPDACTGTGMVASMGTGTNTGQGPASVKGSAPDADPTPGSPTGSRLVAHEIRAVLALPAPLREQTFWHLLHETGGRIDRVLALDLDDLDLPCRRSRDRRESPLRWADGSAHLLPLLILGRVTGPVFVTARGRLSYRRAAELFTAATRPLDPRGRGWTLRQLQR
nr:hypothetical protein [Streptomyces sp. SID4948]